MRALMLSIACIVTIAGVPYPYATSIEGTSGYADATDTCVITLPRLFGVRSQQVRQAFPVGAPVTVQVGYTQLGLPYEFVGHISRVTTDDPIQLHCEDAMWRLKQISASGLYPAGPLRTLMRRLVPADIPIDVPDVQIDAYRYSRQPVAQVLRDVCRRTALFPYFRLQHPDAGRLQPPTPVLSVGMPYRFPDKRRWALDLAYHVPDQQLEFRYGADYRFRLTVQNHLRNGAVQTLTGLGDPDGEERTLTYYAMPASRLRDAALSDFQRMKYDGFVGDLQCFGAPPIRHGDVVRLTDAFRPEIDGDYLVDKVTWRFDEGFFRTVTLGPAVAAARDYTPPTA